MKKIQIYFKTLTLILLITSCTNQAKLDDRLLIEKDNTEIGKQKNLKSENNVQSIYSGLSLNELLNLYEEAKKDSVANFRDLDQIVDEVYRLHEIKDTLYVKYRKNFWGTKTPSVLNLPKDKMKAILGNASDTSYIQFTFSNDTEVDDFNYNVVNHHVFNSYVSCFPSLLIKNLINEKDFKSIWIGKGINELKNPPSSYNGKFNIAMIKYIDKNDKERYFDIVDNPTIGTKKK